MLACVACVQDVDVEALAELTEDELSTYGVSKQGWRKKLLKRYHSLHM
jgi:hypothetical protein